MRQFVTIALNAFMELIRQPIFLLLTTASAVFEVFLATPYYFAFGDEPKLVKNCVLAVMLLAGLFGAVLSASSSLAREIRTGTALAVLAKPIGRAQFILAKYAGLMLALTVMTYVNLVAGLIASRMVFDAYSSTDIGALVVSGSAVVLAYAIGGFSNFFLRRPFVSDAVFALVIMITIGAFVIFQFTRQKLNMSELATVDWRLVPAAVLILFALWILAGLALACSTRFDTIPTLVICSAFFLIGIMSDYIYWKLGGKSGGTGGPWWATTLYTIIPNWQNFWLADVLETGKSTQHIWGYVGKAFGYVVGYVGATLSFAVLLFEDRELS
jgi:ABC-2 type transport system permease protein